MGGTIQSEKSIEPKFLIWAISILRRALAKVQVIKGWLEDGVHREKILM